jgi:hypothetical protein
MHRSDLDVLDSTVADLEGFEYTICSATGVVMRPDKSRYAPTRCDAEAARLIEKYIKRVARLEDGCWVAVSLSGRAYVAPTLPIAVCMAATQSQ